MNAQKYVSRPSPKGCFSSGGFSPRLSATKRKTSVTVSATECAASDSIADEWLIRPPISLAIAMARLARPATMTVPADSPPESCASAGAPPLAPVLVFAPGWSASSALRIVSASVAASGGVMPSRCPDGRDPNRVRACLADADQVDDEHQGRAGLDDAAGAALAVGLVRGDGQPAPSADLHAGDALVPALDDHADAEAELQRVAAVPGGVELLTAVVGDAHVVRAHQTAGGRFGPVTDDDVLDHEVVRRRPGGGLDVRSGQVSHGFSLLRRVGPGVSAGPIQAAARARRSDAVEPTVLQRLRPHRGDDV